MAEQIDPLHDYELAVTEFEITINRIRFKKYDLTAPGIDTHIGLIDSGSGTEWTASIQHDAVKTIKKLKLDTNTNMDYLRRRIKNDANEFLKVIDELRTNIPEFNKVKAKALKNIVLVPENKYLHDGSIRKMYQFARLVNAQSFYDWLFEVLGETATIRENPRPDIFINLKAYKICEQWKNEGFRIPAIYYFLKDDELLTDSNLTNYTFCKEIGSDPNLKDSRKKTINNKSKENYNRIKRLFG